MLRNFFGKGFLCEISDCRKSQTLGSLTGKAGGLPILIIDSPALKSNPFIYGRPVRPNEFFDRDTELRTIFNRLRNGESTAVVGQPHIGKTSLLMKIADEETQRDYLGDEARHLIISSLDLHPISNGHTPADFWAEAMEPLREWPGKESIAQRLKKAVETNYTHRSLEQLFNHLGRKDRKLVLLLDEFDRLLNHPQFQASFFALLRSLITRTDGLALVIASRLSVAEMNDRGRELLNSGSPFFNMMIDSCLGPFDEPTVDELLDQAGNALSLNDRCFICAVAGHHPFLLQTIAAALIETSGDDGDNRHVRAAERFYNQIAFHFDDFWHSMDDRSRTSAIILSLLELGNPILQQHSFYRDIEWTIGTKAFVWWVHDVVVTDSRKVLAYDEWLANKSYCILLTQEQWDWLIQTTRDATEWAENGIGVLAQALSDELIEEVRSNE